MILDANGKPIPSTIGRPGAEAFGELEPAVQRDVRITRSFSFKLNLGNYESADFFASQAADCAAADADTVSADLYEFCVDEVMKAVKDLKERRARKEAARLNRSAA